MNQRIIHSDAFHFSFEVELDNYMRNFLIIMRKLPHDDHTNPTKISLMIHNAEIIKKKDNSDYL